MRFVNTQRELPHRRCVLRRGQATAFPHCGERFPDRFTVRSSTLP